MVRVHLYPPFFLSKLVPKYKMKALKIILSIAVLVAYVSYIYVLAMQNSAIFNSSVVSTSMYWYIWLVLIVACMIWVILYIMHILTKSPKIVVSVLGILIMLWSKYMLLDDTAVSIYISDIWAIIWFMICVLTRFGILLTEQKFEKWEYSSKVEIIEI